MVIVVEDILISWRKSSGMKSSSKLEVEVSEWGTGDEGLDICRNSQAKFSEESFEERD